MEVRPSDVVLCPQQGRGDDDSAAVIAIAGGVSCTGHPELPARPKPAGVAAR